MFEEGFLFDELSEAKKDILQSISEIFPEESSQFIKEEARKLLGIA